jgi:hypothetical protein
MRKFICGCQMPSDERLKGDPALTSLDTVTKDAEGFVICSVHHMRMVGWRVPTHKPLPDGMAGATDLEWQEWVLYGVKRQTPKLEIGTEITYTTQDLRDNRDPEADFDNIMLDVQLDSIKNAPKNGHHKTYSAKEIAARGGNEQMRYQRELAQSYQDARESVVLTEQIG